MQSLPDHTVYAGAAAAIALVYAALSRAGRGGAAKAAAPKSAPAAPPGARAAFDQFRRAFVAARAVAKTSRRLRDAFSLARTIVEARRGDAAGGAARIRRELLGRTGRLQVAAVFLGLSGEYATAAMLYACVEDDYPLVVIAELFAASFLAAYRRRARTRRGFG